MHALLARAAATFGLTALCIARTGTAFHVTAGYFGVEFFESVRQLYGPTTPLRVLEVGSQNVNGALRSYAPKHWQYIGVDLDPGDGVDIVLKDPYIYPFADGEFDLVVSSAAFEHTSFFWLAFLEMLRVLRLDGHMYIMAPSNVRDHGDMVPPDAWRFLKDAGISLAQWGLRSGYDGLRVVQSFIGKPVSYQGHEDWIAIFTRRPLPMALGNATSPDELREIPTTPPATFESARDYVISGHSCWHQVTPAQSKGRWRFNIPELRHASFSFASTCCLYVETNMFNTRSDVQPTHAECWGAPGRSYHECCPHIMTD